jgi:hypothetical protein
VAALPDDDGPTMSGAPGEARVDHALPPVDAVDGDDTTTAEAGPPAAAARSREASVHPTDSDADDPHDQEDRTVQQRVEPPGAARKPSGLAPPALALPTALRPPSRPPSRPPAPVPAAGTPASAPLPSTQPSGAVAKPAPGPVTQTTETEPTDLTDELADDLTDDGDDGDDDLIEDSITATAPRISPSNLMDAAQSGHGVPLAIPGSVEIRTVDHDDLLDETEIRTRPGYSPLQIPETLRGSPAPMHGAPETAPSPPRPAAGRPPNIAPETERDHDDSATAQSVSPAMAAAAELAKARLPDSSTARAPDTTPQSRSPATQVSPSGRSPRSSPRAASPRPAAGMPFQPDVVDEPPTRPGVEGAVDDAEELATRPGVEGAEPATRPGVEGADEPATQPGLGESPTRPGVPDPDTAKRLDVKRIEGLGSYANEDDDEDESVTTRGRVAEPYEEKDESVTTQAPAVPHSVIEAAIRAPNAIRNGPDATNGTTQRLKKTREAAADASPADGEAESITTQAPGPLTNILRVIASGSSPALGSDPALPLLDEDEPPENRTAVMLNAPLNRVIAELASASSLPAIRPNGGPMLHGPQGSAAPRLERSSESGLRVARAGGVDRASLGVLGVVADASARNSGIGPSANALASDGSISAANGLDRAHMSGEQRIFSGHDQPSVHEVDLGKGPRYGLLVAIVAVISVIVPVTLFLVLHHPSEAPVPGVPAEPASEIEKHDGARQKGVRGKNGQITAPSASVAPSASAAPAVPSASASAKPGAKGFPFRR